MTLLAFGCSKDEEKVADTIFGDDDGISSLGDGDTNDGDTNDGDDDGSTTTPLLDVGSEGDGTIPCSEGQLCECEIPPHVPCDAAADTPLARAMGLNCANEIQVTASTSGNPAALGKRNSFGSTGAFPPQEGSQYVVIGSGRVDQLDSVSGNCSSDLGSFDPGSLPAPLEGNNVGAQTCTDNPNLVGMGDCSNTISGQLAGTVNDYTEIRFTVKVPETVNSISYDLAFFSIEYPDYYLSQFNDMYIGWLESEVWTGNISFDAQGNPISLNAGFLDYKDASAANDPSCGGGCTAPELHGTCMQGHAGTKWLTSSAGVRPGETITVVFAIFDMSDSILDSYVFLDNFQWGCDGDLPPKTVPIG